jgi:parvulin-like peptidyl-prolyl isomerase
VIKKIIKNTIFKIFLICTFITITTVCCGGKEDKNEPSTKEEYALVREIAKVRGKTFHLGDFKKYLKFETYGNDTLIMDDETMSFYLDRFLEQKALLKEAIDHKITVSDQEINQKIEEIRHTFGGGQPGEKQSSELFNNKDWIEYFKESNIINKYAEVSITSGVVITQGEEKEYYKKIYNNQKPQRRYNLSQISMHDKKTAQNIKNQLDKNKNNFEELAKKYSITPERDNGGAIGWYTAEELPEYIARVVTKLQPGQISDIIESENGFLILRLDDTEVQYPPSFQEAQEFVRHKLLQEKREDYLIEYIKNIWQEKKTDKSGIIIYFENLEFTYTPIKR